MTKYIEPVCWIAAAFVALGLVLNVFDERIPLWAQTAGEWASYAGAITIAVAGICAAIEWALIRPPDHSEEDPSDSAGA